MLRCSHREQKSTTGRNLITAARGFVVVPRGNEAQPDFRPPKHGHILFVSEIIERTARQAPVTTRPPQPVSPKGSYIEARVDERHDPPFCPRLMVPDKNQIG